jgi:hypothetical protein
LTIQKSASLAKQPLGEAKSGLTIGKSDVVPRTQGRLARFLRTSSVVAVQEIVSQSDDGQVTDHMPRQINKQRFQIGWPSIQLQVQTDH